MMLPYSIWMGTPLYIRQKIAAQFGIAKVRSTSVVNNVVTDDGYDLKNVENVMSVSSLQEFLKSDEQDILVLFQHLVDVMDGKVAIIESEVTATATQPVEESTLSSTEDKPKVKKAKAKKKK